MIKGNNIIQKIEIYKEFFKLFLKHLLANSKYHIICDQKRLRN